MTTYFVTRHPGAVEWAKQQGVKVDKTLSHLTQTEINQITEDDVFIGILPINIVADICNKRGRFFNLSMSLPPEARGRELSAEEMSKYNSSIEEFFAMKVE
jgi:CRISPR-associated protein Csx16